MFHYKNLKEIDRKGFWVFDFANKHFKAIIINVFIEQLNYANDESTYRKKIPTVKK